MRQVNAFEPCQTGKWRRHLAQWRALGRSPSVDFPGKRQYLLPLPALREPKAKSDAEGRPEGNAAWTHRVRQGDAHA
jgi:hypothetical protein